MDAERISIAKFCQTAAYDGSMSFPEIVGKLIEAGFEGYMVDYRAQHQTYYHSTGDSLTLPTPHSTGPVTENFDAAGIEAQIKWAQANSADYSYKSFCENVKAAGCAGYLVSFTGKRAVYFGKTGEMHVEHFPQQ